MHIVLDTERSSCGTRLPPPLSFLVFEGPVSPQDVCCRLLEASFLSVVYWQQTTDRTRPREQQINTDMLQLKNNTYDNIWAAGSVLNKAKFYALKIIVVLLKSIIIKIIIY